MNCFGTLISLTSFKSQGQTHSFILPLSKVSLLNAMIVLNNVDRQI